ncbi:MAG: NAD+ synthase, partial [Kiritimatiellia bacterium]|nr:NAD+ synthase [Kiritimatiellia bacterium]
MNATVGALRANGDRILDFARRADAAGAGLVLFPEMALPGYPPEDLALKPHFLEDCEAEAERIAGLLPSSLITLFGSTHRDPSGTRNAAILCAGGKIAGWYSKLELPNYGVFDEKRIFQPGTDPGLLRLGSAADGFSAAIQICEDSWIRESPALRHLAGFKPACLLNLSASPYHAGKLLQREQILAAAAATVRAPMIYCNLVGGQDELVFDGGSMVLAPDGRILARARRFEEDLLLVDLPITTSPAPEATDGVRVWSLPAPKPGALPCRPRREADLEPCAEIYSALTLGLRDYMDKNGFRKALVALSGGIDSALVASIAADAIGPDRVVGITLPSRFSSAETRGDAQRLADALGIEFHFLSIQRLFDTALDDLSPLFAGKSPDLTEENLQARLRGLLVMALSNKFGWLVLATGNKSELATGYCTLYGDMVGGFAVLKDVFKMRVFELSRWRNAQGDKPVIPVSILDRPPSAELRDNQKDSDSLPPYDVLDAILERAIEQDRSVEQIVADGFDPATVRRTLRMVDAAEYKRRQGAPGVKITTRAFGRDRRIPMTNQYR